MPLVCVTGTELSVVIATKNVEHAVRADEYGVVAAGRHPADALSLRTPDDGRPANPLGDVAKPQLSVVIASEPKDVLSGSQDNSMVISAT